MKTDPFDDAIRRKLEGVNPPYQEKSWTHFQRFMSSQGFPPSLWQTPARWLQPALMAAAVTGVVLSTVWQYRTTQSLNEHVQTLTKTVERMEQVQMRLQQALIARAGTLPRVDTVYLAPAQPSGSLATRGSSGGHVVAERSGNGFSHQQETIEPLSRAVGSVAPVTSASPGRNHVGGQSQQRNVNDRQFNGPTPPANQLVIGQTTARGNRQADQPQSAADQPVAGQPQLARDQAAAESPGASVNSVAGDKSRYMANQARAAALPPERGGTRMQPTGQPGTLPTGKQLAESQLTKPTTRLPNPNDPTLYVPPVTNQAGSKAVSAASSALAASGPLASVQPLTPLALSTQNEALAESWQQHLRRVRYRSPYTTTMSTPVAVAEPASPAQHTTPLPVRFRLGIGGDVGTAQLGPGVYAEAILANKWTISTGISQFDWVGDEYSTEKQFTAKTKRDFRRDYPGSGQQVPVGPGRPNELMNINRTAQSIGVPVQVGYRIRVATHYVLTPSVGVNLSVNPRETATYSYDRPLYGGEVRQTMTVDRPVGWYSSLTAGIGAERQWGHFVAQLSPVALLPIQESGGCLNSLSVGLRGRLFYQF